MRLSRKWQSKRDRASRVSNYLDPAPLLPPLICPPIDTLPVDLASLSQQQLSQVKKQLDDEVQHLSSSYAQLRAAQQKFAECISSIANGVVNGDKRELLVPLTTSLYVPGRLASADTVLVDIGTGFYVEKSTEDATRFYKDKVAELAKNTKDLEAIVNGKAQNLRLVEEGEMPGYDCAGHDKERAMLTVLLIVLRQKMLASQRQPGPATSTSSSA